MPLDVETERRHGRRAGVAMQTAKTVLFYPTETVLSNEITRKRIVLYFKDGDAT